MFHYTYKLINVKFVWFIDLFDLSCNAQIVSWFLILCILKNKLTNFLFLLSIYFIIKL